MQSEIAYYTILKNDNISYPDNKAQLQMLYIFSLSSTFLTEVWKVYQWTCDNIPDNMTLCQEQTVKAFTTQYKVQLQICILVFGKMRPLLMKEESNN